MIYGVNFGAPSIPDEARKVLREHVRKPFLAILVGVCETPEELDYMGTVANNGHRKLHFEGKGKWYGVYAG